MSLNIKRVTAMKVNNKVKEIPLPLVDKVSRETVE